MVNFLVKKRGIHTDQVLWFKFLNFNRSCTGDIGETKAIKKRCLIRFETICWKYGTLKISAITTALLYQSWMSNVFAIPWNFPSKKLFTCPMDTVLCKSNANDYRRLLRFVLPIYCRISVIYRSFSWHLKNDKSTRYGSSPAMSCSDDKSFQRYIVPAIYC